MKKIVILMLSVILCFGLAACGGGGEKEAESAPVDLSGEWVQANSNLGFRVYGSDYFRGCYNCQLGI